MRLAKARIVTSDVIALSRFYANVTQVAPVGSDQYVELRTPSGTLAISSAIGMSLFGEPVTPSADRSVILDFEVADVDAERARLEGIVVDWVLEPRTQPWGNRSMMFRDPDGNPVNVFSRSPVRVGGRGQ